MAANCPRAPFPGLIKGSPGHQFALSQVVLFPLFVVCALAAFWSKRHSSIFLRKRSFNLLLLGALGSIVPYCAFGIYPYVGAENFPCALYICLVYLCNPCMSFPMVLKVAQYQNKVSYLRLQSKLNDERRDSLDRDEIIIGHDPLQGEFSLTTLTGHLRVVMCFSRSESDRILNAKFSRTRGFVLLWFCLTAAPFLFAFLVRLGTNPHWLHCTGCEIEIVDAAILITIALIALALSLLANPKIFFRVSRHDALRLMRESMLCWHIGGLLVNTGFILFIIDPADAQKTGAFDYKWLLLVSAATYIYIQTFHQIFMSWRLRRKILLGANMNQSERLREVLGDKQLRTQLESYLDSELSPEVMRFLNAVDSFKRRQRDGLSSTKRAQSIYDKFIKVNAEMQINLSASTRETIQAMVAKEEYPLNLFDEAYDKIKQALLLDGFPRFLDRMSRSEFNVKRGATSTSSRQSNVANSRASQLANHCSSNLAVSESNLA